MIPKQFEWDYAKAASNKAKHGVSFELARDVFDDIFAIEKLDEDLGYGELRYSTVGMAGGCLLQVAYTMRGEKIRIISARGAEPYERRLYHNKSG